MWDCWGDYWTHEFPKIYLSIFFSHLASLLLRSSLRLSANQILYLLFHSEIFSLDLPGLNEASAYAVRLAWGSTDQPEPFLCLKIKVPLLWEQQVFSWPWMLSNIFAKLMPFHFLSYPHQFQVIFTCGAYFWTSWFKFPAQDPVFPSPVFGLFE